MKTETTLLAVHKTFEKEGDGLRSVVWYVSDGITTKRLTPKDIAKFISEVHSGMTLRFTAVNSTDAQLLDLADRGARIEYAYWHDLGIEKSLPPEEIASAYVSASQMFFRPFVARPEIAELRNALAMRNAVLKFYGDAVRRFKQVGRNMSIADGAEEHPLMEEGFHELDTVFDLFKADNANGRRVSLDKKVEELAKAIPECVLFNEIAGIKGSWITAASIVAYAGGMDRFPAVASFWHYFGQHVIDGKAPKRKAGTPCTWSTIGRTTVYLMGDSLIKNRNNPWRPYYEQAREQEKATHAEKHPNCPAPDGHCTARAKRKMCKEILKRFFLAANGQEFKQQYSHIARETHQGSAVAA